MPPSLKKINFGIKEEQKKLFKMENKYLTTVSRDMF